MQLKVYILIAAWIPLLVVCLLTMRDERYWRREADARLQQVLACHQTVKQQRDIAATSNCAAHDQMWAQLFRQQQAENTKVAEATARKKLGLPPPK